MRTAPPARNLLLREKNASLRPSQQRSVDRRRIRRTDLVIMMDIFREDRALYGGRNHIRQQQVRDRLQPVPSRRMPRDLNPDAPQLLHESPDFRPCSMKLLRNLGSADNNSRIFNQQTNDAPKAGIRLLVEGILRPAACSSYLDAGIIDSVVGR
jgi:hypothetical protein